MATLVFAAVPITDDASFRVCGKRFSDAIVAMGLTRVADAGSVNWTTVARPAAYGNAGFEIFAFADALQATFPVLIKIIWGCGAANDRLMITVQVGFTTDGSGAFTGFKTTSKSLVPAILIGTSISRVSGAANRIILASNVSENTATYCDLFSVERTHDAAGGDTAEGVFVFYKFGNAGSPYSLLTYAGGELDYRANYASVCAPSVGHGSTGTQTMVFPIFPAHGPFINPSSNVLAAFPGNVTAGVPFTVTIMGAAHSYLPLPTTGFFVLCSGTPGYLALLMRND